ncbi:MAG: hypothetical protein ACI9TH_001306 [Kiritimatiellia bacterium]|jgi:hypothetical protein
MTGIIIATAVTVVILGAFIFMRSRPYKKIFSPRHYQEFAQTLGPTTEMACHMIGILPKVPYHEDARFFVTSAGIACAYSIKQVGELFDHHVSISVAGRVTPRAVGSAFSSFVGNLVGMEAQRLRVGVSKSGVFHTMIQLSAEEQAAFKQRKDAEYTTKSAAQMFSISQEQGVGLEIIPITGTPEDD